MEVWKDIKGYEGSYQVSSLGNVRSLDRIIVSSSGSRYGIVGVDMKPYNNKYLFIILSTPELGRKSHSIHRLVASAFIDNPEKKRTVNHKDGNKLNNCVDNLEWNTHGENHKHAFDVLGRKPNCVTGKDHHASKCVKKLSKSGCLISKYDSVADASRDSGLNRRGIARVCRGERDIAYGFRWEYA